MDTRITIGTLTFTVPALAHDAMMLARYGARVPPMGLVERRIVAALCAHLAREGWAPVAVWDGDTRTAVDGVKPAMELIFDLDQAHLYFGKATAGREHWVFLVRGNSGWDVISDHSYTPEDPDGFLAAMDAFDAEVFA